MQQVQYTHGDLWGALGTELTIPSDSAPRAAAAWFDVRATVNSKGAVSAQMHRQGYVGVAGNYVLYPAIVAAPSGKVVMVTSFSGLSRFPSAAYSVLAPGGSAFGPVTVAATGSTFYDPLATRWGDYSWAVLDPSGRSVWTATEYMPPKASQTTDGATNWGTRVLNLATS
jgi:hypothetical protein